MQSKATISAQRFHSILFSKKLNEILYAYFDYSSKVSFQKMVAEHKDIFEYWAHESYTDYSVLIKLFEMNYGCTVDFEISDKKISFTGTVYSSWLKIHSLEVFILWAIIQE